MAERLSMRKTPTCSARDALRAQGPGVCGWRSSGGVTWSAASRSAWASAVASWATPRRPRRTCTPSFGALALSCMLSCTIMHGHGDMFCLANLLQDRGPWAIRVLISIGDEVRHAAFPVCEHARKQLVSLAPASQKKSQALHGSGRHKRRTACKQHLLQMVVWTRTSTPCPELLHDRPDDRRLQPPAEANRVLEAAVLAAKPNREIAIGAEELAENCYVAYFDRIFGKKDPVFTEYRLPAMAVPPPLQVLCAPPC